MHLVEVSYRDKVYEEVSMDSAEDSERSEEGEKSVKAFD